MRIVLITGNDLGHRYVANHLAAKVQLAGIVVDHGKKISRIDRIRQLLRRYTLPQLASRAIWAIAQKVWGDELACRRAMLAVLGPENCRAFSRPDLISHVHGINTAEGVQAVSALEPDVLLVFGTGIVGKKVLSLPRNIALNMHTGVSPYYRGCDCYFWPLYNQQLDMLGATVHECVKEVDGGRIFGTTRIQLGRNDDLFAVFARCISAGANLYADLVCQLTEHALEGTPQDLSLGLEYKAFQKGLGAEWKVRRAIKAGLIRRYVEAEVGTGPGYMKTVGSKSA